MLLVQMPPALAAWPTLISRGRICVSQISFKWLSGDLNNTVNEQIADDIRRLR